MRKSRAKRSKAQQEASRKWAAAGRKAEAAKRAQDRKKGLPTASKSQHQAALKWAAAGRAAQARKRLGLKPLPKHPRALPGPAGPLPAFGNDTAGVCTAAAVAAHLHLATGILAADTEVAALHYASRGILADLLELIDDRGLAGARLEAYWPLAVGDLPLAGTIAGLRLPQGRHCAVALSDGRCLSWGQVIPLPGETEEAWWLQWAT